MAKFVFDRVENVDKKEEKLNVFYHFLNKFQLLGYVYFVVFKCLEFGPVQNFVVW